MKLWLGLGVLVVVIFTGGVMFATYQNKKSIEAIAKKESEELPPFLPEDQPQPKVEVVGGDNYDFGRCEANTTGSHSFKLKNVGQGDLQIKPGTPTCKCTIAGVERTLVKPGETVDVAIEWKPVAEDPHFRQEAPIHTNDRKQRRVTLVIHGAVTKLLSVKPDAVEMRGISSEKDASGEFLLYTPFADEFQVTGHTFGDPAIAKFFDVKFSPAPQSQLDAAGAKNGYVATILVKPGLPLGRFQQTIRVKTDIPNTPEISVQTFGTVSGQISVVGDDWDDTSGILTLGTVAPSLGAVRDLQLCVRGQHQDLKIEDIQIKPGRDVLTAEIVGDPVKARNGKLTTFHLRVAIPKGAPPVNCLGWGNSSPGEVLVKTNHPETPMLKVIVKFAVRQDL